MNNDELGCLMVIRVINTDNGWRVEQNDNFVPDAKGNTRWADLGDALAALRSALEVLDFKDER
jgi:hypothetical protein